jgi:ABC-type transporter Mla subunit MlaD
LDRRKGYIVVRAKINISGLEAEQMRQDAVQLVERGMRAQTQLAGITGQQYLAIDLLDPAKHPPLEFSWTPKYTYVPSAPSLTGEIVANAQAFLAHLNEVDIKRLGENLNALVATLDRKVNDAPVAELVKNANSAIQRIDRIIAAAPIDHTLRKLDSAATNLDGVLADPGLKGTVDNVAAVTGRLRKLADNGDLDSMVKHIDDAAERIDGMIGDNQYDIRVLVQDLRTTAGNLRVLSETIKRYPAGALVAGPPERVQFPGSSR